MRWTAAVRVVLGVAGIVAVITAVPVTASASAGSRGNAGTGFFVSAEGHFVTAHHVLGGCRSPAIETPDGILPAKPLVTSESQDLTVIGTGRMRRDYGRFPKDPAAALAHPVTIVRYRSRGGLASRRVTRADYLGYAPGRAGVLMFRSSETVLGGNSGSPVISQEGTVVGLIVAKGKEQQHLAYAIDVFRLALFLAGAGVNGETIAASEPSSAGSAVDAALRYTFPVLCLDHRERPSAGGGASDVRTPTDGLGLAKFSLPKRESFGEPASLS